MFEPEIRRATKDDVAQLSLLELQSRQDLRDQRGGIRWLSTHPPADWSDLVAVANVTVACLNEVVLGYLVWVTGTPGVAQIQQVYVDPAAREIGCGDGMMAAAIDEARLAGYEYLEGEALPGDRETKNLYERAGITARLITVSFRL
jgi:ribosomal protein S18 acetylase RimI-like enzyme